MEDDAVRNAMQNTRFRFTFGLKHQMLEVLQFLKFNDAERAAFGFKTILEGFERSLSMLPPFLQFESILIFMEICVSKTIRNLMKQNESIGEQIDKILTKQIVEA